MIAFSKYEQSVLALANYSRFYGIDDKDDLIFRDYVLECKRLSRIPLEEITSMFEESGKTFTYDLYMLPSVRVKYLLSISLDQRSAHNESNYSNQNISLLPSIISAIDKDHISVKTKISNVTLIKGKGLFGKIKNYLNFKLYDIKKYKYEMEVDLIKKVGIKSDSVEELILNLELFTSDIKFANGWIEVDKDILTTEEDLIITTI